jgi:transposase
VVIEGIPDDVATLRSLVARMQEELSAERERNARKVAELETLIEDGKLKYAVILNAMFGRKSERLVTKDPRQRDLFNEAERDAALAPKEELKQAKPQRTRQGGGRRRPPKELVRIEKLHDLPEIQKQCPCCGTARPRIGEDRSEEIEIIPAKAVVVVHVRPKYGPCSCEDFDETEDRAIVQAPAPAKIAPGSLFSNRTIAFFLVAKFADALPFHRQEKVIARMGVEIARGVMARLAIRVGNALAPLLDLMLGDIRGSPVVRMDETPVQVLKEEGRAPSTDSRIWVTMGYTENGPIILFRYDVSRGGDVAKGILGEAWKGFLQTDGYSGYTEIGQRDGVEHVGCWAHIRRKFHELYLLLGKSALVLEILTLIKELYLIEDVWRDRLEKGTATVEEFLQGRRKETETVFEAISAWLMAQHGQVAPQGPLGKAITYALGQFDRAIRYVDHALLTPDNNPVENAIRPFVIGRKNWLFADTPAGAEASARMYSLIETAKANGHEPYRYLCYLFEAIPRAADDEALAALLPYRLDPKSY